MKGRNAENDGPPLELSIEELAPGGDGVAFATIAGARRAVFVRGVATGDRVRARVDTRTKPARGVVLELLASGPDRVAPPCVEASRCGGCDWMHVALDAQSAAHEAHVRNALPHAYRGLPIRSHRPAADALRTRARVHVRVSGGRAVVGMHAARSHEPVPVERCLVLDPRLDAARAALAPLLEGAHGRGEASLALGAFGAAAQATEATQTVRAEVDDRLPVLDLTFSAPLPPAAYARFEEAVARGTFRGIRATCGEAARPAVIGDPTPWMRGADGRPLKLVAGGFAQASEGGNALLGERVLAAVAACQGRGGAASASDTSPRNALRTVELYAGAGNLTVLLARHSADLVAVESVRDACTAARENLATRGLSARVTEASADDYRISPATQLLVLDPPRAGAKAVATRLAASPSVRHIVYVSCDPQTLGRDLALLTAGGYAIRSVETVELFPFTSHVETVVYLERARADSGRASWRPS